MEINIFDSLVYKYFGKKRNYRFYSWHKKCIDKVINNGHGAANLCRFIGETKCLINTNIATAKDITFISLFCSENNITIELVKVDFHKNNL